MDERPQEREGVWEGGWEGHKRAQLLRLARLPLGEKLAWLEEAQGVVRHLQRRDPPRAPEPDSG